LIILENNSLPLKKIPKPAIISLFHVYKNMNGHSEEQKRISGFLAREYDGLRNFVKSYWYGTDADAEDILQDVVLNLFEKVDFNSPIENLMAYVYRSLKNKIIDTGRKRKDKPLSHYDDYESGENRLLKNLKADTTSESDYQEKEKEIEQMFEKIGMLRPDQQEIILATEIEGYTFDELSQDWGIPIGTLLSRKHRAMEKLKKITNQ
jgi:RNA polymerase sigma-70 factor (ECF subfamily)